MNEKVEIEPNATARREFLIRTLRSAGLWTAGALLLGTACKCDESKPTTWSDEGDNSHPTQAPRTEEPPPPSPSPPAENAEEDNNEKKSR